MKYLLAIYIFLCSNSFSHEIGGESHFARTLYQENGVDIFLYVAERVASCYGTQKDMGFNTQDKNHPVVYIALTSGKSDNRTEIDDIDKLFYLLIKCANKK
mgnify:CR=1 FL=1